MTNFKLSLIFVFTTLSGLQSVKAETFTADDFVGDDKVCTQLFFGNDLVGKRPQEAAWGRFKRFVDDNSRIILSSFKNEGEATFRIEGDKLYLDGTETSDGAICGDAKLRTVSLNTYSPLLSKDIYTYFTDSPSDYMGLISRTDDGITITFENDCYLSFRKRSSDAVTVGNYSNFTSDFYNTFSKCILYLRTTDTPSFMIDGIPMITSKCDKTTIEETYKVSNIEGMGQHCCFVGDSEFNLNPAGVEIIINKNSRTVRIPSGIIGSGLVPDFKGRFVPSVNNGAGSYGLLLNSVGVKNYIIEGTDQGTITGTYVPISYEVKSGWHKNHGGDFEIIETIRCSADWTAYLEDINDGTRNTIYEAKTHYIELSTETTPNAKLNISQCDYNEHGIYIGGSISCDSRSDAVESYDVYVISGQYLTAASEKFDPDLEEGHSEAVKMAENLVPDEDGFVSFIKGVGLSEALAKGWNPNTDNNGEMTVYLKYNLKSGSQIVESSARKETASRAYAFGSMIPRQGRVVTGITAVDNQEIIITGGRGHITASGAGNMQVFSPDGTKIYDGHCKSLSVASGLYIVKAGTVTKKIKVK